MYIKCVSNSNIAVQILGHEKCGECNFFRKRQNKAEKRGKKTEKGEKNA